MPNQNDVPFLSFFFSILSIIFYAIVFIPQLWIIYKNKSSDGISLAMILLWCQADTLSILGIFLLNLEINLIIIGLFHFIFGFILLISVIIFRKNKTIYETIFVIAFTITNLIICLVIFLLGNINITIGYILGWLSTIIYIVGRIPQIILNFKRHSTEGLSVLMYIYSIMGNLCYITSVLLISLELDYIIKNMAWIIFTIFTVGLDIIVICQTIIYKRESQVNNV
jgi:uncharacterized protein with PQ loop repeat